MKSFLVTAIVCWAVLPAAFGGQAGDAKKAKETRSAIYCPATTDYSKLYYLNGVPFAVINGDSSYYLLALATERIGREKYFRLWLLFKNKAASPYLFEPLRAARISLNTGDRIVDLVPSSPGEVSDQIDSLRQAGRTMSDIGESLKSATEPAGDKARAALQDEPASPAREQSGDPNSGAYIYEAYRSSFNSAVLRKNTVFRDKNITGYLYFRLPQVEPEKALNITVLLSTPDGQKLLPFLPQESE